MRFSTLSFILDTHAIHFLQDASHHGLTIDILESEAEKKKKTKEEHRRLLQERRSLLQQQDREKQERDDRKLAEELAYNDLKAARQAAGFVSWPQVHYEAIPQCDLPGAPMRLGGFSSQAGSDISGELDAFSGLSSFRGSCASPLANNDEVIDASKMTSGNGDIRVQE